ncbi:MAG TPA: DinB family protein [Gemmatimonadales bacterium]|nr:DinB family protein [Gemmatimonadales bacterium]
MALTPAERAAMIERYAGGPALLRAALAKVPAPARQWRPGPGKWSVHEVIVHCADSETNSHARIRFLLTSDSPAIQAYDQDQWARRLDYHALPLEPALATVEAVRANTVPVLRRMSEQDWRRVGTHPESGAYSAEDWLKVYAAHLEGHSRQIERNLAEWKARGE